MVIWRLQLFASAALAVPIGGLWLHLWQIGRGLKWLEPEPNLLAIAAMSIAISGFLTTVMIEVPAQA